MAKSTRERSEKSAKKAAEAGEEELRHKVRPGTRAMLADLMTWHGHSVISEALQTMILNLHAAGPTGSASAFQPPRHKVEISENVARALYQQGARQAAALDAGEQV